ncbi:MAG: indole-3-glycerol phosphate synthase TrpC [Candidatus Omnitrophota bacterium]
MKTILDKIVEEKKKEIKIAKQNISRAEILEKLSKKKINCRDFKKCLVAGNRINFIGELKKASPVKGVLRKEFDLIKTALIYEKENISAISVLTDKHFCGSLSDVKKVKNATTLPVLRKDFIIEEYQLYESLLARADAVLLIASILPKNTLTKMLKIVHSLGMSALVEVHNQHDIEKVDFRHADIIGINNRDLRNFKTDLHITEKLLKKIPFGKIVISESGIKSRAQVRFLEDLGVNALLIGEGIVRSKDITAKIRNLQGRKNA